jgi:hypothetical protein
MKPIEVEGVVYQSIAGAFRALAKGDLKLITVRWRLRKGWTPEEALLTPPIPPEKRRAGRSTIKETH